ncbi:type IV toxin-antitoxin system AbiEi family antitoxin domain-containing protein [Psychromicrobium lacuslunae]|uniref:type IV toxin-antitoxin system AbiEi family antitoxin domain-containing protein n=1 Tax=Psychromicrobium lacuslunae TaxID=1618207 RepID=UPI003BF4E0EB
MVTKLERLREVALGQHGFVTTAQALDEDVSHAELSIMVARVRIERAARGVHRIPRSRRRSATRTSSPFCGRACRRPV